MPKKAIKKAKALCGTQRKPGIKSELFVCPFSLHGPKKEVKENHVTKRGIK